MVLTFELVDEILKYDHSNWKAAEQHFPVVPFILMNKEVLSMALYARLLPQKFCCVFVLFAHLGLQLCETSFKAPHFQDILIEIK